MMRFKEWLDEGVSGLPFNTLKIKATLMKAQKTFPLEMEPEVFKKKLSNIISRGGTKMVKFEVHLTSKNKPNEITVNAYYDDIKDENNAKKFVDLVLITNNKKIILDDFAWKHLINEIPQAIGHEMQHAFQSRRRDFVMGKITSDKINVTQDAKLHDFGNDDEIESYGLDIAKDIMKKYGYEHGIKILKKMKPIHGSAIFNDYLKSFGARHRVMKKLMKKILLFMEIYKNEKI